MAQQQTAAPGNPTSKTARLLMFNRSDPVKYEKLVSAAAVSPGLVFKLARDVEHENGVMVVALVRGRGGEGWMVPGII